MNKIALPIIALFLMASSCKQNTEKEPELIHESNQAWANAKEINKRVSPPVSVVSDNKDGLQMAIHYSSPFVNGRTIWDSLVAYNKVWRTGANEATVIEFGKDAVIEGNNIAAGSYSLFTIPTETGFTVILNSVADQWGHYDYDESKDVLRFTVPNTEVVFSESLNFKIENNADGFKVLFAWENRGLEFEVRG